MLPTRPQRGMLICPADKCLSEEPGETDFEQSDGEARKLLWGRHPPKGCLTLRCSTKRQSKHGAEGHPGFSRGSATHRLCGLGRVSTSGAGAMGGTEGDRMVVRMTQGLGVLRTGPSAQQTLERAPLYKPLLASGPSVQSQSQVQ